MQLKLFIQCGRFSFFTKIAYKFIGKFLTALALGQQACQAISPCSSFCRPEFFYDFTDKRQKIHSNGSKAQSVGQQGFKYGFESQPLLTLYTF